MNDKTVKVLDVFKAIDKQMEKANNDYYVAKGQGDHDKAGRFAEVKWCLAELKMELATNTIEW